MTREGTDTAAKPPVDGPALYPPSETLQSAPIWRREPYRVMFPLGFMLAWAGVLHWLLHATGLLADYRPVFHAITQIQGFLLSFALGFLMTAIPRRTQTGAPSAVEMTVAIVTPVGISICAWYERFALSQIFWIALVVMLVQFAVRRFLSGSAGRRPPNSFVWIPLSFLMGLAGSGLIAAYGILGDEHYRLHELGRLLLLQGMFTGLVIGVGGMLLPLVTRGESSRDAAGGGREHAERLAHVASAFLLAGSFFVENMISLRGGLALRAALVLIVLLVAGRIWRLPTVPGWQRRAVWVAAWLIPLGYVVAALYPAQKKAGLHLVFIGGFALMALAVGVHVALAHGAHPERARAWNRRVLLFVLLTLVAAGLRGLVDFDQDRFFFWIGCSAAVFLVATTFWASVAIPAALVRPRRPSDSV